MTLGLGRFAESSHLAPEEVILGLLGFLFCVHTIHSFLALLLEDAELFLVIRLLDLD